MNIVFSTIWNSSRQTWVVVSELASRARKSITDTRSTKLSLLFSAVALNLLGSPSVALAACTPDPADGVTTVCSGADQTTTVGTGPGLNNAIININPSTLIDTGQNIAISLGDNARITVGNNALITRDSVLGGPGGPWRTGPNTIEFGSEGILDIAAGAQIRSTGASTQAEAVNLMGFGNSIINRGSIYSTASAAIWFDIKTAGTANSVDNYGLIETGANGGDANVIGVTGTNDLVFINRSGARVIGNLSLGNGNDSLTLETGSNISGSINGGSGNNTFTLSGALNTSDSFSGDLNNFQSLTKTGLSTWTVTGGLGNNNESTPLAVTIDQGILALTGDNSTFNGTMKINAAGTLQARAQNLPTVSLANDGLVRFAQTDNASYASVISGSGSVEKTGAGILTVIGNNTYTGVTTVSAGTLQIGANGTSGSVAGDIVNNAILTFARTDNITHDKALSGTGSLNKQGSGILTLNSLGASQGNVDVQQGTLNFTQNGDFTTTGNFTTRAATTSVGQQNSTLNIGGVFTQSADSVLNVTLGASPDIRAQSAVLGGMLVVNGFSSGPTPTTATQAMAQDYTLLRTTEGITGNFINSVLAPSGTDYLLHNGYISRDELDYNLGFRLTWTEGGDAEGKGSFTLGTGTAFDVDLALDNQTGTFESGWNGRDLIKDGAGTLVLSAANTYTGSTTVKAGTLQTNIVNALVNSSGVSLAGGSTLDLANFNQTITNLNGAGNVMLGSATLTTNNTQNNTLGGVISGSGNLVKNGAGQLTLTGDNTYTGNTTISTGILQVGNGGTSGTLTSDVANNGTLTFNRSDDSSYNNVLSGSGSLAQQGTGVVILKGVGSSQGSVSVDQGTLKFMQDGVFSTIGDYSTQNGATTSIGQLNSTLNIGGVFTQSATATLDATLGSPPDITAQSARLNGSLLIKGFSDRATPVKASEITDGQSYTMLHTREGITGNFVNNPLKPSSLDYLLYEGYITDDTLDYDLGFRLSWTQGNTTEANGDFTLAENTAFDVDVVLADRLGPFVSGWNGQDLRKEGTGLLILSAANTYSGTTTLNAGTLKTGIINAFANSSSVTLASGSTLDLNGFEQSANNLAGAGDVHLGSAVLTINNTIDTVLSGEISGSGSLVKKGTRTLTLSGANSYSGDTALKQGRINLGNSSALGDGALLMDDGTELGFVADNLLIANNIGLTGSNDPVIDTGAFRETLSGAISGTGILSKVGSGTLIFSGANTYSGATHLEEGTLQAGAVGTLSALSTHHIASGSFLDLAGFNQSIGGLNNAGTVSFNGTPGTLLTVNGDYHGSNGVLNFNTVLNGDSSATDKLIVNGNTSGSTLVNVTNAGGTGAPTLNGIQLVQVNGLSDGEFVQNGRITAGAYDYTLVRGQAANAANWYLTSKAQTNKIPVVRPEAGGYASNLAAANNLFSTRLHDRLGETQYIDVLTGERKVTSMWLRNEGGHNRSRLDDGKMSTQANRYVLQLGGDIAQWSNNGQDRLHLGVMTGYANSKSRTVSGLSGYSASASVDGYSVGLYGTWYANQADKTGFYVDSWAQYSWFKNSVDGQQLSSEKYDADGITASIESGYTFQLGDNSAKNASYFIQPQAQVIWMGVKADDHKEANGSQVSSTGDGNVQTRLGVKAFMKGYSAQDEGKDRMFQPFVSVNWIHNSKDFGVTLNQVNIEQDGAANIAEVKLGLEGQLSKNVNIWSNVAQQVGDKGYSDTAVMLGGKYSF